MRCYCVRSLGPHICCSYKGSFIAFVDTRNVNGILSQQTKGCSKLSWAAPCDLEPQTSPQCHETFVPKWAIVEKRPKRHLRQPFPSSMSWEHRFICARLHVMCFQKRYRSAAQLCITLDVLSPPQLLGDCRGWKANRDEITVRNRRMSYPVLDICASVSLFCTYLSCPVGVSVSCMLHHVASRHAVPWCLGPYKAERVL